MLYLLASPAPAADAPAACAWQRTPVVNIGFALAMALHFVVNDYGLREHHNRRHDAVGRWVISAAVAAGFAIGLFATVHRTAIAVVVAFLAGGVILNVMKEELPRSGRAASPAFRAGAAAYSAVLLAP